MKKIKLTTRVLVILATIDLAFLPGIVAIMVSVGGVQLLPAFLLFLACTVAKLAAYWWDITRVLRPTESIHERVDRGRTISETELRTADLRLQRAPRSLATVNSLLTSVSVVAVFVVHQILIAPSDLRALAIPVVVLLGATAAVGSLPVFIPLLTWVIAGSAGRNSLLGIKLGIDLERPQRSVAGRLMGVGFALVLTPLILLSTAVLAVEDRSSYESAQLEARAWTGELGQQANSADGASLVNHLEAEIDPTRVTLFALDAQKVASAGAPLPDWAGKELLVAAAAREARAPDRAVALKAVRLQNGRVVGSIVAMEHVDRSLLYLLLAVLGTMGMFGPVAAWLLSRSISVPLADTAKLVNRAAAVGDLSAMGRLPIAQLDEVGLVTQNLNDLFDDMRQMAQAAAEVAGGRLIVELEGEGELQFAFRSMIAQLRGMAEEMTATSTELAGAAAEIFAASQEQEAATTSHSAGMTEVSQTMESLSQSAAHVATAVQGVLDNAERTLNNTDQMVERIDDLTGHANRIADILDVIREIADRSDLLALNGSLEASRAGEAGVGFSLVASEMRRLAERVTGSVKDIKSLVSDIRESGASTVVATEESKKLADGTTQAARGITLVTQQQQSSTEQVTQNVRAMAELVQQSANASVQTRTSAEGLKQQADRLATLVGRFELA